MRYLFPSLLLACTLCLSAQAEPVDTLLNRMVERISDCLDSPETYDEAGKLLEQAAALEGAEQAEAWPVLLYHQGMYYMLTGDAVRAKSIHHRLLAMLPVKAQPDLSISVPHNLAVFCRRDGQTDSALYYYDQALTAAREQNEIDWLAAISMNIGVLHHSIGDYEQAEQYLNKSLAYVAQTDDGYTEMCALQISAANLLAMHKADKAEEYIRRAWELALESESADWQVRCITTMVSLFDERQQPDSARVWVERGNALLDLLPQESITTVGFISSRANHYYSVEDWAGARADYSRMLAAQTGGTRERDILERLSRCYAHLGYYYEAYCYMDSARMRSDSIAAENIASRLAEFNVKYQSVEKDLQIARLNAQRTWLVVVIVAVLLMIGGALLWYRQRRQRREAQMRIHTLEEERRRLAKELHDGLCNDMLALEMQMQVASADALPALSSRLGELRHQARLLSHQLMPPEFTHLSIHRLLSLFSDTLRQSTPLEVSYSATPADDALWQQLPSAVSHELYRIVQERSSNIVKGATATRLSISLSIPQTGRYRLLMTDDGKVDPDGPTGLGSRILNDRMDTMKGRHREWQEEGQNCFELVFEA